MSNDKPITPKQVQNSKNVDKFTKELDVLLEKYQVQKTIMLIETSSEKYQYKVLALSKDPKVNDHDFAELFEACASMSTGFRKILDHVSVHSMKEMLKLMLEPKPRKAD